MNEKTKNCNIDDTLKERVSIYGNYSGGIRFRANLMRTIKDRYYEVHKEDMPDVDAERLRDIVCKLSRLAVSPDHIDSWHDISGYAKLAEDDLRGFFHLDSEPEFKDLKKYRNALK